MSRKKSAKPKKLINSIKEYWALFSIAFAIIFILKLSLQGVVKDQLYKFSSNKSKAIIVNEKNFWGNSRVSYTFSYSYEFTVNGNKIRNDSNDKSLSIGDSVLIEYFPNYPQINRMLEEDADIEK
ncbi:MAG: hypothetical protein ACJAUD_002902 [Crocinitomicaceae bacterium]|jgi:hypothetical protein